MVLVLAGVLVVALVGFLALGRWKNRLLLHEIPKRLGIDVKQEANGFTHAEFHAGHSTFKITASKVEQLKNNIFHLHSAHIELFSPDGKSVDRIEGEEFQYDQKAGIASASGPVEITIMRPDVAPAVAPHASAEKAAEKAPKPLANLAHSAESGQIHVKTNGLIFNQKTGMASTDKRLEFSTVQGQGSADGARFDSGKGLLVLDRSVELNVRQGSANVVMRAQHAELERSASTASLRGVIASYKDGTASAGQAQILFRQDGSAARLDAQDGILLSSTAGTHVKAPTGSLDFNEKNQPARARLQGGVEMDSARPGEQMRGKALNADLTFSGQGELRSAHFEHAVQFHSEQQKLTKNGSSHAVRDWRSPVLDAEFRHSYANKVGLASMRGTGGVVVTGETRQGNGPAMPSKMAANIVTGYFGDSQQLTHLLGEGNATLEQSRKSGVHLTTTGDRLEAWFVADAGQRAESKKASPETAPGEPSSQVESATVDGHVVVTQQGAGKSAREQSFRATAAHARYEGSGEMVHLTGSPRVEDPGFQLAADRIDVSQAGDDAFAQGNVKATWLSTDKAGTPLKNAITLGGREPAHVVAGEAQFHMSTGEATFRGQVRMWQQANSIVAPVMVLNRSRQTLTAKGNGASEPVIMNLSGAARPGGTGKRNGAQPIRLQASELKYSEAERKAVLNSGSSGGVMAETGTSKIWSDRAEIILLPPGNHAGENGSAAQVDKITAHGHIIVTSGGRRGTGEQLVYSGETGQYVLTGTAADPPQLADAAHGTVTGNSLSFNSRDDSVSIEGGGRATTTVTTVPR